MDTSNYKNIVQQAKNETDKEKVHLILNKLTPEEEVKFQKWLDTYHKQGKIGTGDYNFYSKKFAVDSKIFFAILVIILNIFSVLFKPARSLVYEKPYKMYLYGIVPSLSLKFHFLVFQLS